MDWLESWIDAILTASVKDFNVQKKYRQTGLYRKNRASASVYKSDKLASCSKVIELPTVFYQKVNTVIRPANTYIVNQAMHAFDKRLVFGISKAAFFDRSVQEPGS